LKVLFVYPKYPETFWSFKHALKFVSKKAAFPPLGLLTVAAMLPGEWQKKLVDMNVKRLKDKDIKWADYVFVSAMMVQQDSTEEVIARCNLLGTKVIAGGPLFTTGHEDYDEVDHFVLGEAEVTMPLFLKDLEKGCPEHIYSSEERPDITKTPIPLWSLIKMGHYSSMNIQYSRGCPYNCEFCDIIILNGHKPRTKTKEQLMTELDVLYERGWRGSVFIVDDNFIGNKRKLKEEILPAIIKWRSGKKHPFDLFTEASINLADDEKLMKLMTEAGFRTVFIGIETPHDESLAECAKSQNRKRDMVTSVKKIQNFGMEVQGGFIVGFDSDPLTIFKSQIRFIQQSGIVTAMVGLLNAPRGTRLYKRLMRENRLIKGGSGNNTDCSLNFIPKMNYETLINGYRHILKTIYAPRQYYKRIESFLKEYKPQQKVAGRLKLYHIKALVKSMWILGVRENGRWQYWGMFISTLFKQPNKFPLSISLSVYGYHFRKVLEGYISLPVEPPAGIWINSRAV
jgi:radical SAM superfamily enzyme YgiQ (UPF0313 family)